MIPDPDPDSDHPLFHLRHPCVIPVSSPLSLSLSLSSFSLFREYFGEGGQDQSPTKTPSLFSEGAAIITLLVHTHTQTV